jgi:hypothetical protein
MKTIAQFVNDRITSLAELKDALQTAMQLEFSTIPPIFARNGRSVPTRVGSPT